MSSYLLVDGENIDRTLGQILDSKPRPNQRPRWERVREYAEGKFADDVRALFFLNATHGIPGPFVQALRGAGYVVVPVESADGDVKVVDKAIQMTLQAILKNRPEAKVALASHDSDFVEDMEDLADSGCRTAVMAFEEYVSGDILEINDLEVWDMEQDVNAFDCGPLPRMGVIDITEFDPMKFI